MTSLVPVSARLAKLKAELVNIIYVLPEKPMRWVDKDELPPAPLPVTAPVLPLPVAAAGSSVIAVKNTDSAVVVTDRADVVSGTNPSKTDEIGEDGLSTAVSSSSILSSTSVATSTTESQSPGEEGEGGNSISNSASVLKSDEIGQMEIVVEVPLTDSSDLSTTVCTVTESVQQPVPVPQIDIIEAPKETKVERKLKRRLKRRQNNERIMSLIQSARTPQELLDVLVEVEEAIPKIYKYTLNDEALPSTADTCAALAVRIYVLDRRIRYEEIKEVEKQGMDRQYRPRYQFSPRCLMSSSCNKFLSHAGKCLQDSPLLAGTGSRIPDINDVMFNYASNTMNPGGYVQRASTGTYNVQNRYLDVLTNTSYSSFSTNFI